MEIPETSIFVPLPREILVDLLLLIPTTSVINFYSLSSAHLNLFDGQSGLWEYITRRIFKWSALETPVQREADPTTSTGTNLISWKKEFRIASYIRDKLNGANFRATANASLVTIEKNSLKGALSKTGLVFDFIFALVQSDTVLYPLPIGNFSTAYFEVEIYRQADPQLVGDMLKVTIGGALAGFKSLPGGARSSYGFSSSSFISVDCEYSLGSNPCGILEHGDIMGFGINFEKSSVFFTKNGNLVHETAKSLYDKPLPNLMNLHATMSMISEHLVVNMGSHPFSFDLLKYQQSFKNESKPLRLYSEIIVPHLVSLPDKDVNSLVHSYYFTDGNITRDPIKLPHYIHLLTYGRSHPESKVVLDPHVLMDLDSYRQIMNLKDVFSKLQPDQTERANNMLLQVAPIIEEQFPDFKSRPWPQKVAMADNVLRTAYHEQYMHYVPLFIDELMEYATDENSWSLKILAMYQVYFVAENANWIHAAMWPLLDPENKCHNLQQLYLWCINTLLQLRLFGLIDVIIQRSKINIGEKIKECNVMEKISCGDKFIDESYKSVILSTADKLPDPIAAFERGRQKDPFGPIIAQHEIQKLAFLLTQPQVQNDPDILRAIPKSVLYGIFKLKIPPTDNFASIQAYLEHIMIENTKVITNELKIAYLESVLASLADLPREQLLYGPVGMLFGFEFDRRASVEDLRNEAKKQLEERIEKYRSEQ